MTKIKAELLTGKKRNICRKIASLEKGLVRKRAVALLAVDDGLTQISAAEKSGLTLGQVRYAVRIYRKKNLLLFQSGILENAAQAIASSAELEPDKKTAKKGKKGKKGKKAKKGKKTDTKKTEKKGKKKKDKGKKASKKNKNKKGKIKGKKGKKNKR